MLCTVYIFTSIRFICLWFVKAHCVGEMLSINYSFNCICTSLLLCWYLIPLPIHSHTTMVLFFFLLPSCVCHMFPFIKSTLNIVSPSKMLFFFQYSIWICICILRVLYKFSTTPSFWQPLYCGIYCSHTSTRLLNIHL